MNFQAVLLQPHKKSATKRLREVLNSVFRHLDEVAAASVLDVGLWPRTRCGLQSGPPPTWEILSPNGTRQTVVKPTFHKHESRRAVGGRGAIHLL